MYDGIPSYVQSWRLGLLIYLIEGLSAKEENTSAEVDRPFQCMKF
jgi:hypothetical protein